MLSFHVLAAASLIVAGFTWIVKAAFTRPRTIPELVDMIDIDLAKRLYAFVEDHSETPPTDRQFWEAVGGFSGIPHLLWQGRLLMKIVIELRKIHPDLFEWEAKQLSGTTSCLFLAILGCLRESLNIHFYPKWRSARTRICATTFCNLSADVEVILSYL